ncbi:MAG TPA: glycoside hydrolase family 2 protein [bacterium]|nr:glycoside hydrolase family 2 protein [bacterium]
MNSGWIRMLGMGMLLSAAAVWAQVERQELVSGWMFSPDGDQTSWLPAEVPGCVHTDLMRQGLIPDPHYRVNEKYMQWVGEKTWLYRTRFMVDAALLARERIELVCEGLDTYATLLLNGHEIGKTDNMFRTWRIAVKPFLVAGENTLEVRFGSVFAENLPKWEQAPFRLTAYPNNDQADIKINMYSRKAGFHYGWDWGPRLITCGIWRPIRLEAWDGWRLEDLQIRQKLLNDREARMTAEFMLDAEQAQTAEVAILLRGKTLASKTVQLTPGHQNVRLEFVIKNPRRWWSNGLGEPYLYTLTGRAEAVHGAQKGKVIQEKPVRIGLRTLRIVREKDAGGRSMYVELNGVPVFMKGANYIPQDNFQNRVIRARYEKILGSARDAHMNMLRIWGGGIYEEDMFYDLCDEYGILIWHDFMFACAMYPDDAAFVDNIRAEVRDNLLRLRNHPCIALWCGNNENQISWYGWGWRDIYPPEIRAVYEAQMHLLFDQVLPAEVAAVDPGRYYHPGSPATGYNQIAYGEGDVHYWGVWHNQHPFSAYKENLGRFVSEYGFQSYPEAATVEGFTLPEDRELHSPVMLAHQRCMSDERRDKEYGNRLIQHYLEQDYRLPKDFYSYLYLSQVLQAEGVKQAIQAHRAAMPFCMGSLYWQIDDCWPVASWSSIDYHGRWKALHYFARAAYGTFLLAAEEKEGALAIRVISDSLQAADAVLELQVMDFAGHTGFSRTLPLQIAANSSRIYYSLAVAELLGGFDRANALLRIVLRQGGRELAHEIRYFAPIKSLELPVAGVRSEVTAAPGGCRITLTSPVLAKNLLLQCADADGFFSDNYFDLLPGETRVVYFATALTPEHVQASLRLQSVRDTY